MKTPNRDVKFVIYQVLYILVVCVIALKGADLTLTEVIDKSKVVEKSYADSLKNYIDSLTALGLVPRITLDSQKQNLADLQINLQTFRSFTSNNNNVPNYQPDLRLDKPVEELPIEQKKPDIQSIIQLDVVSPTQYTYNSVTNGNRENLLVTSDGSTIANSAPGTTGKYLLQGQKSVTFVCGTTKKTVSTVENKIQQVTLTSLNAGGADASLRRIQMSTGYRVTVSDDFVGQIDVSIKGSVQVSTVGAGVYDVRLNVCGSQAEFDRKYGNSDAPYTVTFSVTATDKISGKVVNRQGAFTFGEW